MPSLAQLLQDSMPFTAAQNDTHATLHEITGRDFRASEPDPSMPDEVPPELRPKESDENIVASNFIWQFDHDAATPGTFRNIRLWSRGMGMRYKHTATVCTRLIFDDLLVTYQDGRGEELPLTQDFVVGAWHVAGGKIDDDHTDWWRLRANADQSLLVAFVFEERDGGVFPMSREEVDALGESFMPGPEVPDFLEFLCTTNASARICIGNTRHLALVSLTTCRERPDFVGGDFMGFARLYPHVMFMSTNDLATAEVHIRFERPAKAMTHGDPEMEDTIKALVVTDANRNHTATAVVPGLDEFPLPVADNIFDYYATDPDETFRNRAPVRLNAAERAEHGERAKHHEDHLAQQRGEVTLADARFTHRRTIDACVARDGNGWESIDKEPRQGQFDNVHLAPRMKLEFVEMTGFGTSEVATPVKLQDIAMVFVCFHDCLHMHVRWGAFTTNKSARGFANGRPHAKVGAPAVPENQSVLASFSNSHTLNYRALAETVPARQWQVFCHHGAAYPIERWPTGAAATTLFLIRAAVTVSDSIALQMSRIYSQMPDTSWAAFYWRCRWTGNRGGPPVERLQSKLSRCLR